MREAFFGSGGPACIASGIHDDCDVPTARDIRIKSLSASEWSVIDRRFADTEACSLLGFIEERNQQFEVTYVRHGVRWFTFMSFAEALGRFSESDDASSPSELETPRQLSPLTG